MQTETQASCTRRWEWAEDAEMTLKRPIHHLTCGRIVHVQAMLTYHVTLTVWLCRESYWALRTSEWLLTCIANKINYHSIWVHNSRRPLSHLTIILTLTLTFDLIFTGGRGIVMDYSCAKFGDFCFSCFGFIKRTEVPQTESHTQTDDSYTHVTTVGMSSNSNYRDTIFNTT